MENSELVIIIIMTLVTLVKVGILTSLLDSFCLKPGILQSNTFNIVPLTINVFTFRINFLWWNFRTFIDLILSYESGVTIGDFIVPLTIAMHFGWYVYLVLQLLILQITHHRQNWLKEVAPGLGNIVYWWRLVEAPIPCTDNHRKDRAAEKLALQKNF